MQKKLIRSRSLNSLFFIIILFNYSCSLDFGIKSKTASLDIHKFSIPNREDSRPQDHHVRDILIVGTNDFHGNIDGGHESIKNLKTKEKIDFQVGKSEVFASYIEILRKKYPHSMLLVDAGDTYSGTLVSQLSFGKSIIDLYNYLKYDAITIGNHEFDYGDGTTNQKSGNPQKILKKIIAQSKTPYVVSNIFFDKDQSPLNWKNVHPYLIKNINGVKVGIIGTTTEETPDKTVRSYTEGLKFTSMREALLNKSKLLREKGAEVIVLITHSGMDCSVPEKIVTDLSHKADEYCNFKKGELDNLLKDLPPHTVDAVVAGHTHKMISYFIHGIPVIQSKSNGRYFGMVKLFYDTKNKQLLSDKTYIYPAIKICSHFFDTTLDCAERDEGIEFNSLIPATFLGEKVSEVKKVTRLLQPYKRELKEKSKEIISNNKTKMFHHRNIPSDLGMLVADAIRYATKTKVAVNNSGGVRTDLESGEITFNDIYAIAPFQNNLMSVELSGKELINLVKLGTSGMKEGLAFFSGLDIVISESKDPEIENDLNQDGQKQDWERDRLVSVKFSNGEVINENNYYKIGTQTFLGESGGDNFGIIFNPISDSKKDIDYSMTYRDAIILYFKEVLNKRAKGYHSQSQNYLQISESKLKIIP